MLIRSRDSPGFFSYIDNLTIWAYYALNYIYKLFICFVWFACLCGRSTRSQAQIFAYDILYLCALKFCSHARTDKQERHPEKCAQIPSPEHGGRSGHLNRRSGISGIYAICRRSAADQRKRSARARTVPGIDRQRSADRWRSEKQASKL